MEVNETNKRGKEGGKEERKKRGQAGLVKTSWCTDLSTMLHLP